jgi:hypothetical protein
VTTPMRKILPQLGDDEQPRLDEKGEVQFNLTLQDRVIVNGLQRARPGVEVKPLVMGATAASSMPAAKSDEAASKPDPG